MQRPRPRRSEFKSTSHANARAPNLTVLKPQQKDIRNKKHHTNAAPCSPLITEKRGRPRPKGGNNIAFNYECCNYTIIAVSPLAGSPQYTLVSGPNGPLTRRYATTAASPRRDHSDRAQERLSRFKEVWLIRVRDGIGRTYQNSNRLRRATAPLTNRAIFNSCWRLHAAKRHSEDCLRTARQSGVDGPVK